MAGPEIRQAFSDELLRAVAGSDLGRVEQLLDSGLGTDCVDSEQTSNTTLHWAANFSNKAMVELLVRKGAEVDRTNSEGCTALHDAVGRGDEEVAMALIEAKASCDIVATGGRLLMICQKLFVQSRPCIPGRRGRAQDRLRRKKASCSISFLLSSSMAMASTTAQRRRMKLLRSKRNLVRSLPLLRSAYLLYLTRSWLDSGQPHATYYNFPARTRWRCPPPSSWSSQATCPLASPSII